MKKVLIVFLTFTILLGCSNDNDDINEVNIRLFNASTFDYKNIVVGSTSYNDLDAGQKSDYKIFEGAYRYAFVELEIDGRTHTLQPVDFVGETQLKSGFYTYKLDANDSQEQYGKLSITLIED